MRLSISNNTSNYISSDVASLPPGGKTIVTVEDDKLEETLAELDKLGSNITYRVLDQSPLSRSVITVPLTLYVAANGDDSNAGTVRDPFRTIQAALDSLKGVEIAADITIQVGAGDFDGFTVEDLEINKTYVITVLGSVEEVDGVSSSSGVVTSGASYSLTDSSQTWVVDELKGMMCEYQSASSATNTYAWIQSNSASNLLLLSGTPAGIGKSYKIVRLATRILPSRTLSTSSTGKYQILGGADYVHSSGLGVQVRRVKFDNSAPSNGSGFGVRVSGHMNFRECLFSLTETGAGTTTSSVTLADRASVHFQSCQFRLDIASVTSITPLADSYMSMAGMCWFYGTGTATQKAISYGFSSSNSTLRISGALFESVGVAIESKNTALDGNILANFNSCTLCVDCRGSLYVDRIQATLPTFPYNSSGNTTFINARGGDNIGVASGVPSGLATNDIIMASANPVATYTLAAMRALTPAAVTDTLGTVVGASGTVL